jgi:hypothetical protein
MVTSSVGSLRNTCFLGTVALIASAGLVMVLPTSASATPVSRQVRVAGTDWVSAGVGGIGTAKTHGGKGTITLKGVKGKATGAWLSWNGIGPEVNGIYTGSYDNPTIRVNGHKVTGVSQGESGSNCWGDAATSRTYLANVTRIVKAEGNGKYHLTGLGAHGDANGASLVVTFKDHTASNNQDLYLFYGNDTDASGYPGEDFVWNDPLTQIDYQGGPAKLQLAVADGQDFGNPDDGSVTVTGNAGPVTFDDIQANHWLWDGTTVRNAHHSRAGSTAGSGGGSLYDLETFDVTSVFTPSAVQAIALTAPLANDCHSLTMAALSVKATGHQPPAPRTVSVAPASVKEGTRKAHCHPKACPKYTHLNFTVSLSRKAARAVTVKLHTQDGTALAPSDYIAKTSTVRIKAHHRSAVFHVNVVKDKVAEPTEVMYAVITSASVDIATGAATGTIRNDDGHTKAASRAGAHLVGSGGRIIR